MSAGQSEQGVQSVPTEAQGTRDERYAPPATPELRLTKSRVSLLSETGCLESVNTSPDPAQTALDSTAYFRCRKCRWPVESMRL